MIKNHQELESDKNGNVLQEEQFPLEQQKELKFLLDQIYCVQ